MAVTDSIAIAVTAGVAFNGFFLAYNAYKLTSQNDTNNSIGIFLLLMSFVHTIVISSLALSIAQANSLTQGALTALTYNYFISIIVFILVTVYFTLRVMILPMIAANKKKKFSLEE